MDLSRLPGLHYVDDDEGSNPQSEQRERELTARGSRQGLQGPNPASPPSALQTAGGGGRGGSSSSRGQHRHSRSIDRALPLPPPPPPFFSAQDGPSPPPAPQRFSTSGSFASEATKYSPSGLDTAATTKQLGDSSGSSSSRPYLPHSANSDPAHPAQQQQATAQRVAFAAEITGRPPAFPTLSYGGPSSSHGAAQPYSNVHPGIRQTHSHDERGHRGGLESGFSGADVRRKKSLVRPERERLDPDHRLYNYRQHAALSGAVAASNTGYAPHADMAELPYGSGQGGISALGLRPQPQHQHPMSGAAASNQGQYASAPPLRRGKSILGREEGMANESGLSFLKRGATLRRNKEKRDYDDRTAAEELLRGRGDKTANSRHSNKQGQKAPLGIWMIYCYMITALLPGTFLKACGEFVKQEAHSLTGR